ncbi:MAG: hypothetical protein JWP01_2687 [Myxococcales bacterium]|nr:hypothetical protein [Myxococcales bacterium]
MFVRWLLPVVAVLALLASSVTAFAASGIVGETQCCCPDPEICKCHDHDSDRPADPVMKRCSGEAERVAPQVLPAIVPEPAVATETRIVIEIEHDTLAMPAPRHDRPETPPF